MTVTSIYPVLQTDDVNATAAWWRDHFDFEVVFETGWYVSLRRDRWELAVLDARHETIPAGSRGVAAGGLLVNIEVDDADAAWQRIVGQAGLDAVLPIRSEEFGQRHFIVAAPDGVLVDIIEEIEPTEQYAAAFVE